MEIKLTEKQKEIYERKINIYNQLQGQLQLIQNELNDLSQVILSANGIDEEYQVEYNNGILVTS